MVAVPLPCARARGHRLTPVANHLYMYVHQNLGVESPCFDTTILFMPPSIFLGLLRQLCFFLPKGEIDMWNMRNPWITCFTVWRTFVQLQPYGDFTNRGNRPKKKRGVDRSIHGFSINLNQLQSRVKVVAILCFWVHTIGRSFSGGS
jgi:hypothetical protein